MKKYVQNNDDAISILILIICIISIYYVQEMVSGRTKYFSLTFLCGIALTLLAYMVFKKKIPKTMPIDCYYKSKYISFKNVLASYFFIYITSLYLLHRVEYSRPTSYFILISLICVLILIHIEINNRTQLAKAIILFEIILLSINIRWGVIYEYSGMIGSDPIYHLYFAKQILTLNHIPIDAQYSAHPIMHLLIVTTKLLTNLTYKTSFIYSIGFLVATILPLFMFLLCRNIFSEQIALISALFVAICNYLIWYGYMLFATSMGLVYFLILLYFFTTFKFKTIVGKVLVILSYTLIVLVHPLTNVVTIYTIVGIYIVYTTYNFINNHRSKSKIITENIILSFIIFTLSYWIYNSKTDGNSFFYFVVDTIRNKLSMEPVPSVLSGTLASVNIVNEILNMSGSVLVFCIALIGFLHIIRIRINNSLVMSYVIIGFTIFFSASTCQVVGFENILPERWFAFSYLLLAIPFSLGFQILNNSNISYQLTIKIITIFLISFLLITSSIANMDSPIYSKDISLRIGAYNSEACAMNNIAKIYTTKIVTDFRYITQDIYDYNLNIEYFKENMSIHILSRNDLILLRNYARSNRIDVPYASANGAKPSYLQNKFIDSLDSTGAYKIYDNKIVIGYFIS